LHQRTSVEYSPQLSALARHDKDLLYAVRASME
jgi:hypothetical protein